VCNTQVKAAPSAYTTVTYGAPAQTLGTTISAELFGSQAMTGCIIDSAYTGANLKIGGTGAAQTLEWTSSDSQ